VEEIVEAVSKDPVLMIAAAIGVVLILFVVLVVVVANLRIRTYKNRYRNTHIDNEEKEAQIAALQREVQTLRIRKAQNEQELSQFADTKKRLLDTEEKLVQTQKEMSEIQRTLAQTEAKLENLKESQQNLQQAYDVLKERTEIVNEENSKLRVSNARLLMKLETEERFNTQHKQQQKSTQGEGA